MRCESEPRTASLSSHTNDTLISAPDHEEPLSALFQYLDLSVQPTPTHTNAVAHAAENWIMVEFDGTDIG